MAASLVGIAAVTPQAAQAATTGTVAGMVFLDYDADGVRDVGSNAPTAASATDIGVAGALVTITDFTGTVLTTPTALTTDATGAFSVSVTAATDDVRVVVTPPPGFASGPHGLDSGTTVQFVTLGSSAGSVNVGLVRPGEYGPDKPRILSVLQVAAINSNHDVAAAPSGAVPPTCVNGR